MALWTFYSLHFLGSLLSNKVIRLLSLLSMILMPGFLLAQTGTITWIDNTDHQVGYEIIHSGSTIAANTQFSDN